MKLSSMLRLAVLFACTLFHFGGVVAESTEADLNAGVVSGENVADDKGGEENDEFVQRYLSPKSTKAPTIKSTKAPTLKSTKAPTLKSTKAPTLKSANAPMCCPPEVKCCFSVVDCLCCDDCFPSGRRKLGEVDDHSDKDQAVRSDLISEHGADHDGEFMQRSNLLSESSCDKLMAYVDGAYDQQEFDLDEQSIMAASGMPRHTFFELSIDGEKLLEFITKEEAKALLELFYDYHGHVTPVAAIKLQLAIHDVQKHLDYHTDKRTTLVVFLNNAFEGPGGLAYMNAAGIKRTMPVAQGSAVIHGPNVFHASEHWKGKRYILDLKSHFENDLKQDHDDKNCALKQLILEE